MKLIVGLGNPGKEYEHTRHNAGFLALDYFLRSHPATSCQSKFKAEICEYHEGGEKVFIIRPLTFMNLSGQAVREIVQFYKLDTSRDLLVVHDEIDLPFGKIKLATSSSAAGHNGVQNIFDELGTQEIQRLRIGVESRESRHELPTDVFVLRNFTKHELELLNSELFPKVSQQIEAFLSPTS